MPAKPTEICENCTARRIDLRRCAGCAVVRYCSKECQKAHWKEHKPYCQSNIERAKQAEALGPDYSEQLKAIGKWCDDFSIPIGCASASALDLMHHPEHVDSYVLIIYVDYLGPTAKSPYTHDIIDAEVLPLATLRLKALSISPEQLESFDRNLAPRPGMMRILLLDRKYPWSYTTPFMLPSDIRLAPRDERWFEHLQMCVTRPGRKVRERERVSQNSVLAL
ncbi:MYND-type domain-containing protein, partial [Favolaschia claudopus]